MVLSISLVLLTGIVVFILVRTGHQRILPGLVTALFGFSLATTGVAPHINNAITSVSTWVSSF